MIGILLAAALSAVPPEGGPASLHEQAVLSIDPCVDADVEAVGALLDLELGPAVALGPHGPQSVAVRCVDDGQEIRVEPWASMGANGIRTIQLPPLEPSDPAAREGRARELALAIAELVRRLEATHPLAPPEPPPPPPPVPVVATPPPPAPPPAPGRWQLGVLSTAEYFTGGERLLGADLSVAASLGSWLVVELSGGGRFAGDQSSTTDRLSARAAAGSAAAGLLVRRRRVAFGLVLRGEGLLFQLRAESPSDGGGGTSTRGAVTLSAEPRFAVAVAPHVRLQLAAGAGRTVHGILVRNQGVPTNSLTGFLFSGSAGAVITF